MMQIWQLLGLLLRRHPAKSASVLLIGLAVIFSSVGLLATSAWLITFCAVTPMIAEILVPVVYVRLFGLLRGLLRYAERLISHETTFRLLGDLRVTLYRVISRRSLPDIMRLDHTDAFNRLVDDIERLQDFYLRTFNPVLTALLTALMGYFLLLNWGTQEALIFVGIYGATLLILPGIVYGLTAGLSRQVAQESSQLRSFLFGFLTGLAEIRTSGAQSTWHNKLTHRHDQLESAEIKVAWSRSFAAGWIALAGPVTALVVAFTGGLRVLNGDLNPLFLPVEIFAVLALFEAVQPIPTLLQKIETSKMAAFRVLELIDPADLKDITEHNKDDEAPKPNHLAEKSPLSLQSPTGPAPINPQHLLVEQVYYRYPEQTQDLLKDVTFDLKSGQKKAIVGPSGSGKTTLIHVLLGWLSPSQGQVKLIGETSQTERSDAFAVVNQDVYLFNTTIRNNLRIGRSDAQNIDLFEAIEQVGLTDWLNTLPAGLDTELGEGDGLLSGGQRQRLGLARALLRHAPFLILDEATAGIDVATELKLMTDLFDINEKTRTGLLTITHRLVAMDHYDEILVMDQGQIIERGNHAALLAQGGYYLRMWQIQQAII
ncbi:MAG: thiol reductant ABC exporter subunit CydC [Eubacteriales bacterium]|nr:thiol reductant ABC exporter subunit CydC [Eubacteriales bacterium]